MFKQFSIFLKVIISVLFIFSLSQAQDSDIDTTIHEVHISFPDENLVSPNDWRYVTSSDLTELLTKINGMVEVYSDYGFLTNNDNYPLERHMRGGRHYYHDLLINGVSYRNPITGTINSRFMLSGIHSISVHKGIIPIEYGGANSGLISVESRNGRRVGLGGSKLNGTIELSTDNFGPDSFDHNNYSIILGGPLKGNGSIFAGIERVWQRDRTPSGHTEEVLGETRLPNNYLSDYNYHFGFDYNFTKKLLTKFRFDGYNDSWQDYRHYYNNPDQPGQIEHTPRTEDKTYSSRLEIEYQFNNKTFLGLHASYFKNEFVRGDGVVFDDLEAYNRGFANPENDIHNLFREGDSVVIDPTTTVFAESYYDDYLKHSSSYINFGGSLFHELRGNIIMKFGFNYKKQALRYYHNLTPARGYWDNSVIRYGYDEEGIESEDDNYKNGLKHPKELSFYIQGKLVFDKVIIKPGLRIERFDNDAYHLRNINRPLDPDGLIGDGDPNNDSLGFVIDEGDVVKTEVFTKLAPSLTFIVNISDYQRFHFNYRMGYQNVPFKYIYNDWNFFQYRLMSGSFYPQANGGLEPIKSNNFELGYSHSFAKSYFSINAFYAKYSEQVTLFHQSPSTPYVYDTYVSEDFSEVTGVESYVSHVINKHVYMSLSGTISKATGLSSYVDSYPPIAWRSPSGTTDQKAILDYDIAIAFDYRVRFNSPYFSLTTEVEYDSGLPTPLNSMGVSRYDRNRFDSKLQINLHLERKFRVSGIELSSFIRVKNLLDKEIPSYLYPGTGSPTSDGYLESPEGVLRSEHPVNGEEFHSRYERLQNNPENFILPRQIFAGLRIEF